MAKTPTKVHNNTPTRVLNVRPDTLDFRDLMYVPALIEVPIHVPLEKYLKHAVPILDQGSEGACTGFGLATVVNYLFRTRKVIPDATDVSPRMLYEMARRYDEWPGEDYSGSSARGAMKGWNKHGVCSEAVFPYTAGGKKTKWSLNDARTADALRRPLGAYFRVNHKDLIAMHAAISEVGILYATASVHVGWNQPAKDGFIKQSPTLTGGHAFAIVAYDENGFWIQNSWGSDWGKDGFAQISYDDWLENGTDVWVARLGAPVKFRKSMSSAVAHSSAAAQSVAYSYADLRPHIVSIDNDGLLKPGGDYGNSIDEIKTLFEKEIPAAIKKAGFKHILLYAHGGLVDDKAAVQRLADYRAAMIEAGIYPITFIWHSDYWTTVTNILKDTFKRRRPEGPLDSSKDFMLDRLDDALEPLARVLSGKASWDEMKENALLASGKANGGAAIVAKHIAKLVNSTAGLKVHLVGHSAGSIFHGGLIPKLEAAGVNIESLTLWAPACTTELFKQNYVTAIKNKTIKRTAIFALSDSAEQDDHCARIYNKSLLYLVSNAFEDKARIPVFRDGVPLLGMERFLKSDKELVAICKAEKIAIIISPNIEPEGSVNASRALSHGGFDDDEATLRATLSRILNDGTATDASTFSFQRSASSLKSRRERADL